MTRRAQPGTSSIGVRLPDELIERIEDFCFHRLVGRDLVIRVALEDLLRADAEGEPLNLPPAPRPARPRPLSDATRAFDPERRTLGVPENER